MFLILKLVAGLELKECSAGGSIEGLGGGRQKREFSLHPDGNFLPSVMDELCILATAFQCVQGTPLFVFDGNKATRTGYWRTFRRVSLPARGQRATNNMLYVLHRDFFSATSSDDMLTAGKH